MKRSFDSERGSSIGFVMLLVALLVFTLTITYLSVIGRTLGIQRSTVQNTIDADTKDAVVEALSSTAPMFQAGNTDTTLVQDTITQLIAQKLQIPQGNVVVKDLRIYSDTDIGTQAPTGIIGTIPGRSAYIDLQVTWTTPSVWGKQYTGTYPVKTLISLPRYFASGPAWN